MRGKRFLKFIGLKNLLRAKVRQQTYFITQIPDYTSFPMSSNQLSLPLDKNFLLSIIDTPIIMPVKNTNTEPQNVKGS